MRVPRPRNAAAATHADMPSLRIPRRDIGLWGTVALVAAAAAIAAATDHGAFSFVRAPARPEPLIGLTVGDDTARAMPVVTSLRSGGLPEREGVRVGDHLAAIDGMPVDSADAVRTAVRSDHVRVVGLEVVRGDAVWRAAALRLGSD